MKSMSLAEVRQQLSAVVSEVEAFDEHVVITKNGRPAAVLISADEWDEIEHTAFWRAVPGAIDDLRAADGDGVEVADLIAQRRSRS